MKEETTSSADPIPHTGQATWSPAPEDDAAAMELRGESPESPRGVRWVLFGRDGLRAGWSILLFLLVFAALQFGLFRVLTLAHLLPKSTRGLPMLPGTTLLFEASLFALAIIAAFVASRVEHRSFPRYGLGSPYRRILQFLTGLLWGAVMLSLLVGTLWKSGLLALDGRLLAGAGILRWGAAWFAAFLGVGLFEEFLSRGFLQFTLARGLSGIAGALGAATRTRSILGFWLAALFFSVLFGLGHKNNPGESPIGLLSAGLIGLVFAFSLWRTGSLWWAVGFHAAWDWAQSFVYGVADSGTMVQNHLLRSHPLGSPLMSGGLTGPEGSIYILGIILLTTAVIAITLPSEARSPSDPDYSIGSPLTP